MLLIKTSIYPKELEQTVISHTYVLDHGLKDLEDQQPRCIHTVYMPTTFLAHYSIDNNNSPIPTLCIEIAEVCVWTTTYREPNALYINNVPTENNNSRRRQHHTSRTTTTLIDYRSVRVGDLSSTASYVSYDNNAHRLKKCTCG